MCKAAQVDVIADEYGQGTRAKPKFKVGDRVPRKETTIAIVARIDNGQPMPAARPLVHKTKVDAEKEAKRLSEKHRGKEFGVFTLISKYETEATYDHEWQRRAVNGEMISAIKEIRTLTGLSLKAAKEGIEDWLTRNAA